MVTRRRKVRSRNEYISLRRAFQPEAPKLIIIAESPPASGRFFYDTQGAVTEPLFAAMMKQLEFAPTTKESGLRKFEECGWLLVDATYQPVNALSGAGRQEVILGDYPRLRRDLLTVIGDLSTPLVLMKSNICRLLEPMLAADGFRVINRGQCVYFPSNGWQPQFHAQFRKLLSGPDFVS